jgi:hypothetical protein
MLLALGTGTHIGTAKHPKKKKKEEACNEESNEASNHKALVT